MIGFSGRITPSGQSDLLLRPYRHGREGGHPRKVVHRVL